MHLLPLALGALAALWVVTAEATEGQSSSSHTLTKRSVCDGTEDGTYCFGSDWYWCTNGDITLGPVSCGNGCSTVVPTGGTARPKAECTRVAECQGRRYGTYCDGDTLKNCKLDGTQSSKTCDDGCKDRAIFAYCYQPPACDDMSSDAASGLKFCNKPSYEIDTALADDATQVAELDDSAREIFAELSVPTAGNNAAEYCEYNAYRTACAAVFPECPDNDACKTECATYNECGGYFVKKNATQYTFQATDCAVVCQESSASARRPLAAALIALVATTFAPLL